MQRSRRDGDGTTRKRVVGENMAGDAGPGRAQYADGWGGASWRWRSAGERYATAREINDDALRKSESPLRVARRWAEFSRREPDVIKSFSDVIISFWSYYFLALTRASSGSSFFLLHFSECNPIVDPNRNGSERINSPTFDDGFIKPRSTR